jgi:hypothetical protein
MTTYNELKEDFERKVEHLQAVCKHKNVSGWMEEWWAPGHSTGNSVKYCDDCNKKFVKKCVVK